MFTNTSKLPNHSSLVELLKNDAFKYFQTPNHSSSLELPLKNDIYQYFLTPKSQMFGRITSLKNDGYKYFQPSRPPLFSK